MTNQECNQVYWSLPEYYRNALDALLYACDELSAVCVLIDQAERLEPSRLVTAEEAREWYAWRKSLRQMQGRD